ADVINARPERLVRRDEGRAAGRAAVGDVDERDPGGTEVGDHRVGVAGVVAAAVCKLDVAPRDAGVGEGATRCLDAHGEPAHSLVAAERVDPPADNRDGGHAHVTVSSGSNAYDGTPAWWYATTRIGIPILSLFESLSVNLPATRR